MDWEMLMEPLLLFTIVTPTGESAPPAVPLPPQAPHCHVVRWALCREQPICWKDDIGLQTLWGSGDVSQPASPPVREAAWNQVLYQLTAASMDWDNVQLTL